MPKRRPTFAAEARRNGREWPGCDRQSLRRYGDLSFAIMQKLTAIFIVMSGPCSTASRPCRRTSYPMVFLSRRVWSRRHQP